MYIALYIYECSRAHNKRRRAPFFRRKKPTVQERERDRKRPSVTCAYTHSKEVKRKTASLYNVDRVDSESFGERVLYVATPRISIGIKDFAYIIVYVCVCVWSH